MSPALQLPDRHGKRRNPRGHHGHASDDQNGEITTRNTERNRRTEKRSAFRHRRTNAPTHQAAQATWHPPREPAAPPAPLAAPKNPGYFPHQPKPRSPHAAANGPVRPGALRGHPPPSARGRNPSPLVLHLRGLLPPRGRTHIWKSVELRRPRLAGCQPGRLLRAHLRRHPHHHPARPVRHAARIRQHLSPPRLGATGRHRQHPRHRLPVSQLDLRTRRHPARRPRDAANPRTSTPRDPA